MSELGKMTDERVLIIFNLCTRINNETDYCCFFEMSGHVQLIRLRVCESEENFSQTLHNFSQRIRPYIPIDSIKEKREKDFFATFNKNCDELEAVLNKFLDNSIKYHYKVSAIMSEMSCEDSFADGSLAYKHKEKIEKKFKEFNPCVVVTKILI